MVVSTEHAPPGGRKKRRSHREVADVLRDRIRSGSLRPGQRMPTQAELADEFGVERGAVREALRILHREHLLSNVSKGSPATVAEPSERMLGGGGAAQPQPTMVGLAPRVSAAFDAPHVEIEALCLTSVSLTMAIGEPLRRIHAGQRKPAKVDVRVLLPSRDIDLAFPAAVDGGEDEGGRVHRRWLDQRNAQGQVLRHNLLALRASHGIDVSVQFRALPFTPPVKLYLLNGSEALFAYYTLTKRDEEIGQESLEMYDAQGTQSMLFPFRRGDGLRDATFVEQSRLWFDALWNTISRDLELAAG
ncbi:GntR family transcriptional regulator [Streptomyces sp. G44]|uniref:FadR/GntR family transcriptional regulator n=1 Tax=Streptomyces sp. G44 TaxID=2807632 RepID=UPI0019606EC7|nr:GntR family transcriptional regulator [Streptomyces sp. G44]MBM7169816.1 GntR family transcriptional regulator [Streptomyces sp. G44]